MTYSCFGLLALLVPWRYAAAHSAMIEPPTRNAQGWNVVGPGCPGGSCLFFVQGSDIGCKSVNGLQTWKEVLFHACKDPAEPTIDFRDEKLGTYNLKFDATKPLSWIDWTKYHPWRKPGSAPVADPCGLAGGWLKAGNVGNGAKPPQGIPQGFPGSKMAKLLKKTVWVAGSVAEVAWAIQANHGGGYQYRVCPAGQNLTEECFQQHPLQFVGNKSWLQYGRGMNVSNRTEILATRISEGTVPPGSSWTKNPIPACGDSYLGGACDDRRFLASPFECSSTVFPPPAEGAFGYGGATCNFEPRDYAAHPKCNCSAQLFAERSFDFSIVDQVRVPETPGEYVLSWRYDSEQTPQVWQNCADVHVVNAGEGQATKPFERYEGCEACCHATRGICANCTKCEETKTGDCSYCWTPLPGFTPAHAPVAQCLGHESASGGPPLWTPGDDFKLWSPGCPKCWSEGICEAAASIRSSDVNFM